MSVLKRHQRLTDIKAETTLKVFNNASIDVSCQPTLKVINVGFKLTLKIKFLLAYVNRKKG